MGRSTGITANRHDNSECWSRFGFRFWYFYLFFAFTLVFGKVTRACSSLLYHCCSAIENHGVGCGIMVSLTVITEEL